MNAQQISSLQELVSNGSTSEIQLVAECLLALANTAPTQPAAPASPAASGTAAPAASN